jgi:hypothetical protein
MKFQQLSFSIDLSNNKLHQTLLHYSEMKHGHTNGDMDKHGPSGIHLFHILCSMNMQNLKISSYLKTFF